MSYFGALVSIGVYHVQVQREGQQQTVWFHYFDDEGGEWLYDRLKNKKHGPQSDKHPVHYDDATAKYYFP